MWMNIPQKSSSLVASSINSNVNVSSVLNVMELQLFLRKSHVLPMKSLLIQHSARRLPHTLRACVISVRMKRFIFIRTSWTSEFMFSCAEPTTAPARAAFAGIVCLIRCISRLFLTTLIVLEHVNACFVKTTEIHISVLDGLSKDLLCLCLFMFVYVCLCLFMFVYVCLCLFMFVYVCLCLFMFVYVCLCIKY